MYAFQVKLACLNKNLVWIGLFLGARTYVVEKILSLLKPAFVRRCCSRLWIQNHCAKASIISYGLSDGCSFSFGFGSRGRFN